MSNILDLSIPDYFQVQFVEEHSNGYRLAYVQSGMNVVLTRAELEVLYRRIQAIKAAELKAARWEEAQADYGRWFYRPQTEPFMTANPIDVAWQEMMEGKGNE